jgi:tRNA pseudouridine32 synthase/23S rRNA pseudouridine746 synthase/23S rRNA pseudouridine1911/1915/1917 synthase
MGEPLTVLHRDEHMLVVAKPPGLLSQPDHTGDPDVVSKAKDLLRDPSGREPFVGLVHRLDRPSSGVMVLARTSEAARSLSRQFREREVEKRYLVVAEGTLRGLGTWTDYIAKPNRQPRLVDPDHPQGKRAVLDWQVLASDPDHTLLQVTLRTGRPHQIRLQAASRGHPVAGDRRYDASTSLPGRAVAVHHVLLRAEHPRHPRRQTFTAPPPEQWSPVLSESFRTAVAGLLDRERVS